MLFDETEIVISLWEIEITISVSSCIMQVALLVSMSDLGVTLSRPRTVRRELVN